MSIVGLLIVVGSVVSIPTSGIVLFLLSGSGGEELDARI